MYMSYRAKSWEVWVRANGRSAGAHLCITMELFVVVFVLFWDKISRQPWAALNWLCRPRCPRTPSTVIKGLFVPLCLAEVLGRIIYLFIFGFWRLETAFLCIALAGLELRDPPASAFWVLGLKCMPPHTALNWILLSCLDPASAVPRNHLAYWLPLRSLTTSLWFLKLFYGHDLQVWHFWAF